MNVFVFVLIALAVMSVVGAVCVLAATAGDGRAAEEMEERRRRTPWRPPSGNTRPRDFDRYGRPR